MTEALFCRQDKVPQSWAEGPKKGVRSAPENGLPLPFAFNPRARGLSFWLGGRLPAGRLARGLNLFEFWAAAPL